MGPTAFAFSIGRPNTLQLQQLKAYSVARSRGGANPPWALRGGLFRLLLEDFNGFPDAGTRSAGRSG